jgi:heme ABC exporter ATP-binding subunit CcmA
MLRTFKSMIVRTLATTSAASQLPCANGHAVEAIGLNAVYGRVPVLRNVDLAIAEGESVAVMGPNGAGKSTLLKCLVGAVRPAAGCVRWFGESITRRYQVRRQIGFVGPECGLYAELTALENLLFAGRMYGVTGIHDRAKALLAEAGLELHSDRLAGQLSQGMRQRLAIARALVHEPRLIVLDEPSSALDVASRRWLERLIERLRREGQTVCFATHDAALSRNLADRILRLDAGRLVAIERGDDLPVHSRRSA